MAGIWIFAENRSQALELLSIARTLADESNTKVSALVFKGAQDEKELLDCGADEIMYMAALAADQALDSYVPVVYEAARKSDPDVFLLPSASACKDFAARLANRLETGLCSNCTGLKLEGKSLVMERLAYGGAAVQKVVCECRPVMATVMPGTFNPAVPKPGRQGSTSELPAPAPSPVKILEKKAKEKAARNITESRVIVAVGRGFEKQDDLAMARELADLLRGEIACTRPISEEMKWLPEELCIGLSGAQVKPELYIGIGISGQIQHVTGIRNSKVIAAINKDENAPIFGVADMGIVGNLYDVLPKIINELKR
jgi:electron transfer flavoprotein alpha subunit